MINRITRLAAVTFLVLTLAPSVRAEPTTAAKAPEPSAKYERYAASYVLNANAAATTIFERALTVLKQDAVEEAKQTAITYSTSVEKADVLEAYTRKPDGRHIDVAKDNFQLEVNSGKGDANPAFSDSTTMTVIFPDVAVGDTLVLKYKITQSEPMFPRHFSIIGNFPKSFIYDDVRISVDAPNALTGRYQAPGMTQQIAHAGDRTTVTWTFSNKTPVKDDENHGDVYEFGAEPGYAYSTFPSYAAIAEAYGARAKPRAAVTERVQKLADSIAKDKTTPQAKAEALYGWVRENITYAGNCIGIGAVVPRDLNFVLDNKMGDCKDHATLLQALLSAKGIPSTQALINVGMMYHLPEIPVVSTVNHVINYLPDQHMFLDATAEIMPYGMLPRSETGKPVLLVDGPHEGMTTPIPGDDATMQDVKTVVTFDTDGSATGTVDVTLKGEDAVRGRHALKQLPADREEDHIKAMVKSYGLDGSAKLRRMDKIQAPDSFAYGYDFTIKDVIHPGSAGAIYIAPLFARPLISMNMAATAHAEDQKGDFVCGNGHWSEEYVFTFPKNVKILATPDDMAIKGRFQTYRATYKLKDNVLTVTRRLDDVTPGRVCGPEIFKSYKDLALKALPDIKAQIVYK